MSEKENVIPQPRPETEGHSTDTKNVRETDKCFDSAERRAVIYWLRERVIKWYGWHGHPENPLLLRDIFRSEARIWCWKHHIAVTQQEVEETVSEFYAGQGW